MLMSFIDVYLEVESFIWNFGRCTIKNRDSEYFQVGNDIYENESEIFLLVINNYFHGGLEIIAKPIFHGSIPKLFNGFY